MNTLAAHSLHHCPRYLLAIHSVNASQIANTAAFLVSKVQLLARHYFTAISSFCLIGAGCKEIFIDTIKSEKTTCEDSSSNLKAKIHRALASFFDLIRVYASTLEERRQQIIHGASLMICGVTGVLSQLEALQIMKIGAAGPILEMCSNGFFLLANCISLDMNLKNYLEADKMIKNGTHPREYAENLKKSAILGIVSDVGYIFYSALFLLGFHSAIILVIGCLGCFFGCLKIVYDYFHPTLFFHNNAVS